MRQNTIIFLLFILAGVVVMFTSCNKGDVHYEPSPAPADTLTYKRGPIPRDTFKFCCEYYHEGQLIRCWALGRYPCDECHSWCMKYPQPKQNTKNPGDIEITD